MLIGALLAIPTAAKAPQSNNEEAQLINPPYGPKTSEIIPSARNRSLPGVRGESGRYKGRSYTKDEVIQLIKDYSARYNISPNLPLAIAKCESGYRADAKNRSSTASGVFQWLASSWANQPPGKAGISVFDAEANIQAAVWLIAHGKSSPWNASKHCWS